VSSAMTSAMSSGRLIGDLLGLWGGAGMGWASPRRGAVGDSAPCALILSFLLAATYARRLPQPWIAPIVDGHAMGGGAAAKLSGKQRGRYGRRVWSIAGVGRTMGG
jgi:hypothetical protein